MIQGSATPRSPEGRKLNQEAPGPSSLASQGLLAPQYPTKGLGLGLEGERAEPQKLLLLLDSPQCLGEAVPGGEGAEAAQRENKVVPPSQGEKSPQSQREEAPQGESTEGPQTGNSPMCLQERDPQGQDMKTWKSWEGYITPAWEVAQRAATAQLLEEGSPLGQWRDIPMSVGEQSPPSLERGNPGPRGRATQGKWDKTEGKCHELAVPTLGAPREEAWAPLQGLGAGMPATRGTVSAGRPELPLAVPVPGGSSGPAHRTVGEASFPGALGERRGGSGGLPTSKAAWPAPPGLSPEQQESALQRLLELHGAARRRRWRDREQQRLRVLERLRIAGNRHCRVHPLGLPSGPAHLQTQEDAAEWRRALRERLDQVYQERTGRLRTLGARNTHNFQELLWTPDAEDPVPGE
ncbi:collagen alpha-1(II) chain-like isoform X2 [Cavia porcellus]|uniref:collagen alpha-1(II) chain-like isoform X2 n=1 Tax=Cavia porcellus TaxID=10141 RepID=UPI002FE1683F